MQTEFDGAILSTPDGIAHALLAVWLLKSQEHPTYVMSNHSGVSHTYAGQGSAMDATEEAEVSVGDFGVRLQWIRQEGSPMPRFALSFYQHNRGDGPLRWYDPKRFIFQLVEAPISPETLETMAGYLVTCAHRQRLITTMSQMRDEVNRLEMAPGFKIQAQPLRSLQA